MFLSRGTISLKIEFVCYSSSKLVNDFATGPNTTSLKGMGRTTDCGVQFGDRKTLSRGAVPFSPFSSKLHRGKIA